MAAMAAMNERQAVVEWFESDFKKSAAATTKTSRADDGKLKYSFSVVNNSGFDFDKFSFRIKVINKADGSEIGTATIKAGEWPEGAKKVFKSKLAIPPDVRSLSFVMYANSLDFEARSADSLTSAAKDLGDAIKGMGDAITGADGSGGVFGELFGTGGMPETPGTVNADPARSSQGSAQRTMNQAPRSSSQRTVDQTPRSSSQRTVNQAPRSTSPSKTYSQRKTEKKLNKKRLGKSGWTLASLFTGIMFILAAMGSTDDPQFRMQIGIAGVVFLGVAGVLKLIQNARAKKIRTYESRVNMNGNTSIDDLAAYVGKPFNKVADDLQAMIADGFFPGAYVDLENRLLVMTRNGQPIESVEKSAAINNRARRKASRDKNAVPESLDDLITMTDDPQIKSKLRTLRSVTKKIDARVEEVPELEKQVKDFREKYYPEVVRLTDDYNDKIADMGKIYGGTNNDEIGTDSSGAPVIGSNPNYLQEQADEIKAQLISLIDSVTEASENLLEKLHEDDIMDITTDIKMLQTTLASKGLLDSDFDI